jgi:hypothetical protein
MRTCWESFDGYLFRVRSAASSANNCLPRGLDITLCDQFALIASGLLWNVYFAVLSLAAGFFLATGWRWESSARTRPSKAGLGLHFPVSRLAALHPVLLRLRGIRAAAARGFEINLLFVEITAETRWLTRAWAGALVGAVAEHVGLYRRNLLRRAALHTQGRPGGGRRLWNERLHTVPPDRLADHAAARLAVIHQRGDLPDPRHDAGLFLRLSGLAAIGRCPLLCALFRRPDLQSLRQLPDRGGSISLC